jgi:dTDP-4-amino-4,6-dideoxygalactose transaminase
MITFTDTRAYNQTFAEGFEEDLKKILRTGQYILGDEVKQIEARIAEYIGTPHCVAVSSGTTALEIAFRSLELKPDDEVIVPANAYIACILGALASTAKIVPVDCKQDATLDIDMVESACTSKTKAILVVHLYGDSCDMVRLSTLCKDRSLFLIEDCAQSFGSLYGHKKLGSFGTISCHSFYPTKNLGSLGDAGAICTHDEAIAKKCKMMRNLGSPEKYKTELIGTNGRMDTLQAAFLLRKLDDVDAFISRKRRVAEIFATELGDLHVRSSDSNVYHSYHLFVIRVTNRDEFCKRMLALGIETIIHYPIPYYKTTPFKDLELSFPVTEALADSILSIPVHAYMSDKDIHYILHSIRDETPSSSK